MNSIAEILASKAALTAAAADTRRQLSDIVRTNNLNAVFQPILALSNATVLGFEGLIRGPCDSMLHTPIALFNVARDNDMVAEVEYLCRRIVLDTFAAKDGNGKLFINVSPDILVAQGAVSGETLRYIKRFGLNPQQVVIELTENTPGIDYHQLREAVNHYRSMGFEVAIDDLGEGFSGLRLWSELRPNYVKIDKHFVRGVHADPLKLQFVRSIQEIAKKAGARVIAEGIEEEAELRAIRGIGIAYAQGFYIGRPQSEPIFEVPMHIHDELGSEQPQQLQISANLESLITRIDPVAPESTHIEVYDRFVENPEIASIAVVLHGTPVGVIGRQDLIALFARPFHRELYGHRPCEYFMDSAPLIVESSCSPMDLSELILQSAPHHLSIGFIVTENGKYIGMGSGHDLLKLITQLQIRAAKYANPLTLLPGNVPINEHIGALLKMRTPFVACYCDLDNFKPFNDVYGYRLGDDIIRATGRFLHEACDPDLDFLGHIGGDDFIILFQSPDWEQRCNRVLEYLNEALPSFYNETDRYRGGIEAEDRHGCSVFFPFTSLSIGAVVIDPEHFASHYEVAAAATVAKKQAKKISGHCLFVERRGGRESMRFSTENALSE
ncbi:EAL domain-containing protein [Candidatus Methylospira mobilis]|uniref:EAL domain-containing protein n=1 Tax=Candidatus Methylospira mobilis TaxID=1808979 RepID=A0A5Q0BKW9_9GAMM|nr:EAL domain-containing protein [Candidatus Methylospira mobilis]QFY42416.1 EAL domain-containing protein [Candidatus Methylospira mobilis]WNV04483.1 EAL domain-containing protein [Candidatus Methylospira mobilis]